MRRVTRSVPVIAFDEAGLGERPGRAIAAGRARMIVRGVYTTDVTTPLERVVRTWIWEIIAHLVPDALVVREVGDGGNQRSHRRHRCRTDREASRPAG